MTLENLLRIGRIKEHPRDANQPGHHATILQSLSKTLGLPAGRLAVLDTLRRKRNLAAYIGEDIDEGSVKKCVQEAERLRDDVTTWMAASHPELIR